MTEEEIKEQEQKDNEILERIEKQRDLKGSWDW